MTRILNLEFWTRRTAPISYILFKHIVKNVCLKIMVCPSLFGTFRNISRQESWILDMEWNLPLKYFIQAPCENDVFKHNDLTFWNIYKHLLTGTELIVMKPSWSDSRTANFPQLGNAALTLTMSLYLMLCCWCCCCVLLSLYSYSFNCSISYSLLKKITWFGLKEGVAQNNLMSFTKQFTMKSENIC